MSINSSTPKQGNLTGIPRKLQDSCADFYNLIQKWNKLTIQGVLILRKIASIKLKAISKVELNTIPEQSEYPQELLPLNEQLEEICQEKTKIVSKMNTLTNQLSKVAELRESKAMLTPPFQTWRVEKFHKVFNEIFQAYEKELTIKKDTIIDFAHQNNEDAFTFLTSLWSHQVFISENINLLLESALLETGFHNAI